MKQLARFLRGGVALTLTMLSIISAPNSARAANLVGDANNSGGAVDMVDAQLVLDYLYGSATASQLSPLAMADADGDLDLADLMLVAQVASTAIPSPDGPSIKVSFSQPLPQQDTYGLGTPFPASFPVAPDRKGSW